MTILALQVLKVEIPRYATEWQYPVFFLGGEREIYLP